MNVPSPLPCLALSLAVVWIGSCLTTPNGHWQWLCDLLVCVFDALLSFSHINRQKKKKRRSHDSRDAASIREGSRGSDVEDLNSGRSIPVNPQHKCQSHGKHQQQRPDKANIQPIHPIFLTNTIQVSNTDRFILSPFCKLLSFWTKKNPKTPWREISKQFALYSWNLVFSHTNRCAISNGRKTSIMLNIDITNYKNVGMTMIETG